MTSMKIERETPAPTDSEELERTISWLRTHWPDEWPRGHLSQESFLRQEGAHTVLQTLESRLSELLD